MIHRIPFGRIELLLNKTSEGETLWINSIDDSIKNTEDLLMNYYLFAESEKSVFEDWCPYHYIVRRNSAATKSINMHKLLDPVKVLKMVLKEVEQMRSLAALQSGD